MSSSPRNSFAHSLNSIVCPKTKAPLILDEKNKELVSKKGKLAYPIVDGIPILIIEKAINNLLN